MTKHKFERKLIDTAVAFEKYEENWDGYNAAPIHKDTIHAAIRFIVLLPQWIPEPEICPEPDGEIGFDWGIDKDKLISVSVNKDMRLSYAGLNGENKITGSETMSDTFPKQIADFIKELYAI